MDRLARRSSPPVLSRILAYRGGGMSEANMPRARLVAILLFSGCLLNACGGGGATTHLPQLAITSGTPPSGLVGTSYAHSGVDCRGGICQNFGERLANPIL